MWRTALACQCCAAILVGGVNGGRAYRAADAADTTRCGDEHGQLSQAGAQPTDDKAVLALVEQVDHELKCIALCYKDAQCKGSSFNAAEQQCTLHGSYRPMAYDADAGRMCRKSQLGEQQWRHACETHSTTPDTQAVYYKGKCLVHRDNGDIDTLQKALDTCAAIANATGFKSQLVYVKSASMNAARANLIPATTIGGYTRVRRNDLTAYPAYTNGPWVLVDADGGVNKSVVVPPGAWAGTDPNGGHYTGWTSSGLFDIPDVSTVGGETWAAWFKAAVCEIDNPFYIPTWVIKASGERIIDEHILEQTAPLAGHKECGRRCLQLADCASIAYDAFAKTCLLQRFEYDEPFIERLDPVVNIGKVADSGFVWYEEDE